jgi:hypothetical protein
MQVLDPAIKIRLVGTPCQPIRSIGTLRWWWSAVNLSFRLCLATCRMRSSTCDTLSRSCARSVRCWPVGPLRGPTPSVPAFRSTRSAAGCPALFAGFITTMARSDFSCPCISGFGSSPSLCGPRRHAAPASHVISRFPFKERPHVPASQTTPGRPGARADAPVRVAFRWDNGVGTRDLQAFAAQWLDHASPADASPQASRPVAHGSGPMRIANPSS